MQGGIAVRDPHGAWQGEEPGTRTPPGRAKDVRGALEALALDAERITTLDEYKHWVRTEVRRFFPHQMMTSGWAHLNAGGISLDLALTVDFPASYLRGIRNVAGGIESPILRRWIATREPVLFEADDPWPDTPAAWFQCFRDHELRNVASHGVYDTERCVATYHSFYRMPERPGAAHSEALRQVVPVLHLVLCRLIESLHGRDRFEACLAALSAREKQIAYWARLGKTNGEIASLSGLSQNTVKHHLTSIFGKLGVENRGQLLHRLAEHEARTEASFGTKIV